MADQVDGTNGAIGSLDDAANIEVQSGQAVDVQDAIAIQGISGYTGAGDLDIYDSAAALISAGDPILNQAGIDHIKASDSSVLANVGADLNGFTAAIEFDVSDTADNIATYVNELTEADDVFVVSGDVSISQAQSIQSLGGYNASGSTYEIEDSAANITASTDQLMQNGTIKVDVTDPDVNASIGADLAAFTADIEFDVSDTAANIATQIASGKASGYGADSLEDAGSVVVESGSAVLASQAESIQDLANYSGGDIDITDSAANLISAGDHVLNVTGVDTVTVLDSTGGATVTAQDGATLAGFTADVEFDVVDDVADLKAIMGQNDAASYLTEANSITVLDSTGGATVTAQDGAILASFTADVEFDVEATASQLAAEVAAIGKTGNELDEANSVVVLSGSAVSVVEAEAIIGITGYVGAQSDIDITDSAANLISAGDHVLNVTGVDTVTVLDSTGGATVTAQDGATLAGFTADVEFDVVDDVADLKAIMGQNDAASYLTEANSITVDNGSGDRVVGAQDGAILASFTADVDFDVVATADEIAAELTGSIAPGTGVNSLDEAADVVVSGGDVDAEDAAAIMQISGYNTGGSQFEITDDVASVISAGAGVIENGGVSKVEVTGVADVSEGVALNTYTSNVEFDVSGTADDIFAKVDNLGNADDVFVVSGDVSISEAQSIQSLGGYNASGSTYEIEDSAANITASTDQLMQNGTIKVDVTDTDVNASIGNTLAAFTADIEFDVSDTAANIAAQIAAGNGTNGTGYGADSLEDAGSVVVESGSAVLASQAESIQDLANYSGGDIDITDSAANLISAGDHVLNVTGVDTVTVLDSTGGATVTAQDGATLAGFTADVEFDVVDDVADLKAIMGQNDAASYLTEANSITVDNGSGDRVVGAQDGAILASFTADVDFDVVATADEIAAELTGSIAPGTGVNSLDEAADVVVSGGDVDAEDAAAIMQISGYNTGGSQFEITDDVASVISAGAGVIENGGVSKVEVTGVADVSEGVALNTYTSNVEFDVSGTADDIFAKVDNLGNADDVFVVSGDVSISEAQSIQSLGGYNASGSTYEIEDSAANITASTDQLMQNGTIKVDVTDTDVNASIGNTLAAFTADIEFDVSDTAANIAAQIAAGNGTNGTGYGADSLEDAGSVVVESGSAVLASQAESIQDLANYSGGDIDITDSAANLISAGDHVLNVTGVDTVTVLDSTGGATVTAGWSDISRLHSGC